MTGLIYAAKILMTLGEAQPTRFVRRNLKYPSTIIPPKSNTFVRYKFAAVASELLRYRRICSEDELVCLNEELLKNEYIAAGYTSRELKGVFRKVNHGIETRYSDKGDRLGNTDDDNVGYIGCSVIFDGDTELKLLEQLLRPARDDVLKWGITVKNGVKVKSLVINRRNDLEKMKEYAKGDN